MITIDSVYIPKADKYLYLKNKSRGLNYTVKVISTSSDKNLIPDGEKDLIYKSDLDIFYKATEDTLKVYTRIKADIPKNFPSDVVLKQNVLDNPTYMNLYDTYNEMGLKLF